MTYNAQETSDFSGFPVELYLFSRGASFWRFTSADEDKVVDGVTYEAVQIKRANFELNQEMTRAPINITMDNSLSFVSQFRGSPPTDIVQLTIYRYHENDGDVELVVPWVGRLVNVKFFEREVELRCEPVYTSLQRPALRRRYQTTCPHTLYGAGCLLLAVNFRVDATLTSVNLNIISSATFGTFANGYFAGGYVEWDTGAAIEKRFITDHTGPNLTLNLPFDSIPANADVRAYPGCDHTLNTCNTKFANEDNYGGQPFYPDKNPMGGGGTPIF